MKKFLFIVPLSILLSGLFILYVKADEYDWNDAKTVIALIRDRNEPSDTWSIIGYSETQVILSGGYQSYYTEINGTFLGYIRPTRSFPYDTNYQTLYDYYYYDGTGFGYTGSPSNQQVRPESGFVILRGSVINQSQVNVPIIDYTDPPSPDPPDPLPGSDWLSDMWEWFLWQLGINDDYSGDIDVWVTGGDRDRMEYVTPTPSPTPTPYPSPTPYDLTINYPDGTTGTITGIPGSTTIINGGDTTNNYGSEFDIFAVDVQIGDGGSSNPKDGLNSVMDASNNYLKDVDITPVQNSFSIIPNDWFLLIGVLAALPFIAGFIMRLLK